MPVSPMTSQQIVNLLRLVGTPRDGALLRFSLGSEYLKGAEFEAAIAHLNAAVEKDPRYSAAWKLLGRALAEHGRHDEALAAYRKGIEVAESKGDRQAAKEMTVFARRLEKAIASGRATRA
jgi:predicted Zn-dependent protease